MVTRWSSNESCRLSRIVGKLSSTLILKYLWINWTENQFSCKLWPNLGWSSRCYIGSRAICFYMVMWAVRRAEDVWVYPNTSTCSNRCFGDSTAWMEATTREISWVVEPINPTRDRCMISSGLFISRPWPLINIRISIKLWFMYSCIQCLKIHGPFCWARIKRGLAYMNFILAYWLLLELLHFFSPKDLCPSNLSNIFLISPSPLDHSSSLILERSEICKKFLFYQNISKGQGELIKAKEYYTTHFYYSIEPSNIIM